MSPVDIAYAAIFAASFVIVLVLLAAVTLLLEAVMFVLGLGRRDWTQRY